MAVHKGKIIPVKAALSKVGKTESSQVFGEGDNGYFVKFNVGGSCLPAVGKYMKIISGLPGKSAGQFGNKLFRSSNQTIFWYNHCNFLHKLALLVSIIGASSNTERRKNHV
jgi:hypothetical protein